MDKNLKALFEACGSPETPNDVKEEAYDSYNDETFGSSMGKLHRGVKFTVLVSSFL